MITLFHYKEKVKLKSREKRWETASCLIPAALIPKYKFSSQFYRLYLPTLAPDSKKQTNKQKKPTNIQGNKTLLNPSNSRCISVINVNKQTNQKNPIKLKR